MREERSHTNFAKRGTLRRHAASQTYPVRSIHSGREEKPTRAALRVSWVKRVSQPAGVDDMFLRLM